MALPVKVNEALGSIMFNHPFYAAILHSKMRVEYKPDTPTAMTDGTIITVGDWFCDLQIPERVFVLGHEICHGMLLHCQRGKFWRQQMTGPCGKVPFRWDVFGQAADYVINDMLKRFKVGVMPQEGLIDPQFTCDMHVEEVYRKLMEDNTNSPAPSGFDEHMEPGEDLTDMDAADMERAVEGAKMVAKAQGNMSAELQEVLDKLFAPVIDWRLALAEFFVASQPGYDEADYSQPQRRSLSFASYAGETPLFQPHTRTSRLGPVVVQLDTSMSITNEEGAQFLGEVAEICGCCHPEELIILHVSSHVAKVVRYEGDYSSVEEDFKATGLVGRGGTDMCAGFEWVAEEGIDPGVFVTFTDGYTGWPKTAPIYPSVVCTTDTAGPEWATTLKLEG